MGEKHQFFLRRTAGAFETRSPSVTVVGAQWGDEGKGKIVDWLASGTTGERFAAVVRFNGGNNAGHTLMADGRRCTVTLIPSGVLAGTLGVIGSGVVLDPFALLQEIDRLNRQGVRVAPETLRVADTVTLVLPVHQSLDRARESLRGAIGTTGRGIGPACEDKVGRRALRLCDVADEESGLHRLTQVLQHNHVLLEALGMATADSGDLWLRLRQAAERLAPYVEQTGERIRHLCRHRHAVLFEGAQSVMLDIDHGTYPFVTSSSCIPASAASGAGVGAECVGTVIGVAKAYVTRVGAGPFPTEDEGTVGGWLRERGHEFGTNTGRPRRCGWMDAVLLRHACRTAGIHHLALTKLDVLDGLSRIRIGTAYLVDGEPVRAFPSRMSEQARVQPVYEEMDGWSIPVSGARVFNDLPGEAVRFVRRLEELVEVPIAILSTGPDRSETMLVPST